MSCRFVLTDVVESLVSDEEGYSIFEPTVAFEINGRNVFHAVGIEGARIVVIMHFRESAIRESLKMIKDLSEESKSDYNYWLLGTGFGFSLERNDQTLNLFLRVENLGPTQGVRWPQTLHVGTVSVDEWVEAIMSLSTVLSRMFLRLNESTYRDPIFQEQEAKLRLLEEWLYSRAVRSR